MAAYNINIVKPEEDETASPFTNALHLHSDIGDQFSSSFADKYITSPDVSEYSYPYGASPNFTNNSHPARPQLTHLSTGLGPSSPHMQHEGDRHFNTDGTYNLLNVEGFNQLNEEEMGSIFPTNWTTINEYFEDPNSPSNFTTGVPSPLSQGYSPHTPNTPLLSVEPSPTASTFPSPGSQGSDFLFLSPSPGIRAGSMPSDMNAELRASPISSHAGIPQDAQTQFYAQYRLNGHMSAPQVYPLMQTQHQYYDAMTNGNGSMPHFSNATPAYAPSSASSPYRTPSLPLTVNPTPPGQSPSSASPLSEASFTHSGLSLPGLLVPQKLYRPHTASDQRRYVDEVELDPPILFCMQGPPQMPPQIGMSLVDATTSRFIRLLGRDDPMFENRGPSISVRLVWEGYQPWSRQIPTRDFKTPPGPITRSKLAKNVAKTIERFISEHQERDMEAGADRRWQVGPGKIEMKDLLLVSMHHVSMGSWQANVCLNRPLPSFGLESPH